MTRQEQKELHLMYGLCTYPGVSCFNLIDTKRSKHTCTYHLDKQNIFDANHYKEKKERKECKDCKEPAKPGYVRCEKHVLQDNKKTLKQKQKRILEGRCRSCGGPLHKMGKDTVTCVNCVDQINQNKMFY